MTGMVIGCLLVAVAALGLALFIALPWMHTLVRVNETLVARAEDHDECLSRVAQAVSGDFAFVVLNDAADKWDTIEAEKDRERLRREFRPGDGGVAPMWMRERGDWWRGQQHV